MGLTIIGLAGKKQAGKDTVFNFACELLAPTIPIQFAFATGVKQECSDALGIPIRQMEEKKDVFRKLYQWWGTDYRRNLCGEDYWVDKVAKSVHQVKELGIEGPIFITDVRFYNEVKFIHNSGGYVVRIIRGDVFSNDTHQSETELDNYAYSNFNIVNSGTLEQLKDKTRGMLHHFNLIKNDNSRDTIKPAGGSIDQYLD